MLYRRLNNICRVLVGIISYTYFLVTAMWCVLGLFLLPERVGPYATAIFVISGNAKSIYDHLNTQVAEISLAFIEKIRQSMETKKAEQVFVALYDVYQEEKENRRRKEKENVQSAVAEDELDSLRKFIDDFARNPSLVLLGAIEHWLTKRDTTDEVKRKIKALKQLKQDYKNVCNNIPEAINIVEQYQDKVLKKFGFSKRGAIMSVVVASITLLTILIFLIIGMNTFSGEDAFSAAVASSLSVAAGFSVNKRARQLESLDGAVLEEKVAAMAKMYNDIVNKSGNLFGLNDKLSVENISKIRKRTAETKQKNVENNQ